jgi:hypothetical protein
MNTREIAAEYRMTHWARIVQDRNGSGLSIRAYCENAGIHENTYYYWLKRLRGAACEELATIRGKALGMVPSGFTELKLSPRPISQTMLSDIQDHICIESSGLRITASNEYPIDKLVTLMREVTKQC